MIKLSFSKIFILTACLCSHIAGQDSGFAESSINITSIESIRAYGATKFSDIYQILPEWQTYSIDCFRWNISSNKSAPDQSQSWNLMIDGQRIDFNFMNMKNINLLPLSFSQVNKIESSTEPQLLNNNFTDRGFINFHSHKPEPGFSLNAYVAAGNETGDPGPYKYTKYNSENIDIIGPDLSTTLSYGSSSFDASITYKNNRFIYPTPDKYIGSRLDDYGFNYRKIYSDGVSLLLNTYKLPTMPKVIFLYSSSGKYNFLSPEGTDMLYFSPSAKEIPVNTRFIHIGIKGSEKAGSNGEISYTAKTSVSKMNVPYDVDSLSNNWQMTNYLFTSSYHHNGNRISYSLGGGIDLNCLETTYELSDRTNNHYNINGMIQFASSEKLLHSLELFCEYDGIRAALKGNYTNEYLINENNSLQLTIAYLQRNVSENNDIWYWVNRSYDLSTDAAYAFDIANHVGKNYQYNAALKWYHTFSKDISLSTEVFYNRFTNITLEDYSLARDDNENIYTTLNSLKSHINGSSGGASLVFTQKINRQMEHSFHYNYNDFFNGDALFRDTYEMFPEHKFQYRTAYDYTDDLSIAMSLSYISLSKWYNFKTIDGGSQDDINYKIDSRLLCDLTFQKWFAHDKFRTSLMLKNIFNQKNYYAPNGAFNELSLYFTAEIGI